MHLRSLPAWTPWPPWPTFRRYRELSDSRLASLPRGPTLPSEVPWPPTPSLSGRLHVHDPSLSFSDFTPSTCLALFKVRSEISASRVLFLIALADTGVRASSDVRNSFASASADFSSSPSGTRRSCAAVASENPYR